MSGDNNNLTTDAVPGAPRKIVPDILHQETVTEQKKTDDTDEKTKIRLEPTYNANKKKSKDSKQKKSSTKTSNTSNFFVVNSSKVHFGAVNNFNYGSEDRKSKPHENVTRTDEINRVLNSKSIVSKEHIDMVATHLGMAWRDVGLELGFSCGQLDHFYQDNKEQGYKEVVYQMLLAWSREKAEMAILGDLTRILWNLGEKYIVKELITLL